MDEFLQLIKVGAGMGIALSIAVLSIGATALFLVWFARLIGIGP